jgi:hypothetical protein
MTSLCAIQSNVSYLSVSLPSVAWSFGPLQKSNALVATWRLPLSRAGYTQAPKAGVSFAMLIIIYCDEKELVLHEIAPKIIDSGEAR